MSGKAQTRRVGEQSGRARGTRSDAGAAGKGLSDMKLLVENSNVPTMEQRLENTEPILFLMAEVICKNFATKGERTARLTDAVVALAAVHSSVMLPRVWRMVKRELAKC